MTTRQIASLEDLAALVMDQIELRLAARRTVLGRSGSGGRPRNWPTPCRPACCPRHPEVPGMELATRYLAGQQGLKVGGDFFDVFRLASNDWGIVLGDACGKGARPASLAALTRWTIRGSSVRQFKPSDVLGDVNAALLSDDDADVDGHFCSAVFSRSGAGHVWRLVHRRQRRSPAADPGTAIGPGRDQGPDDLAARHVRSHRPGRCSCWVGSRRRSRSLHRRDHRGS